MHMPPDTSAARLRIYSETLPFEQIVRPRTLELLRRYELEIIVAVRPWQIEQLARTAGALSDGGVNFSVWPMLADEEGRWASAHNAAAFVKLVERVVDALEGAKRPPREVLFDLEPPFAYVRDLVAAGRSGGGVRERARALPRAASPALMGAASRVFAAAVGDLHARGIATASAVWPLVALDPPLESSWQALLGTPVDAVGTARVSVMMYTSILEGWSRGALRRHDVGLLLASATTRARRRWGRDAGMSLGCVGTGALADEPTYRNPSELADDAALARAAGCHDLTLFELGGVLARAPSEAWLDALAHGDAIVDRTSSRRFRLLTRLSRAATWAVGRR